MKLVKSSFIISSNAMLRRWKRYSFLIGCCIFFSINLSGQNCPPNIDFEAGNFSGWTCYTGSVSAAGGTNLIGLSPSAPMTGRHTIIGPNAGVDAYGNFPINCPNGSGYSIKLGNESGGAEAEGVSYEFNIPANENYYSLIYNYAVVFQDPNHLAYQQPRMEIEITNVTDNTVISCSSFTFYPYGSPLPGFYEANVPAGETPVWYKDWSAVSINLDGNAGKRIRLLFKTADCTFRRHFGYAYIDVNSECSGTFVGANYCPDDTAVNVEAPFGYQSYTWYNSNFTQVLGYSQTLVLAPPPPSGTTVAVEVIPYNGYGCLDTFYAQLIDNLVVTAQAGADGLSCNHNPVALGALHKPGLVYHWSPVAGLSNPNIANPVAKPDITTSYVLTVRSVGGGCLTTDTVVVKAAVIDNTLHLDGKETYCIGSGDSAVLSVKPNDSIQWYRDGIAIPGANSVRYVVTQTGSYQATIFTAVGCVEATARKQINISSVPVSGFSINDTTQCQVGNRFLFTNKSTNAVGSMQYRWLFGDGTEATGRDAIHQYAKGGIYMVTMIVSSNVICADSTKIPVVVYSNAMAEFSIKPTCVNLPVQAINNTADTVNSPISYLWNFGNGQTSTLRTPPPQVYPSTGTYVVSLSVNTVQCPTPLITQRRNLVIDAPRKGISYKEAYAVVDYPLILHARTFGDTVLWSPASNLSSKTSFNPVFIGQVEQLYTVAITTNTGCVTIDTQLVKTVKSVEIYVPNAFTPNGDGKNDVLRPLFRGITELRYFRVFNRWGQLWYESQNEESGWNGMFRGTPQETQTVVWVLEGVGVDGKVYQKKGTSVLIR